MFWKYNINISSNFYFQVQKIYGLCTQDKQTLRKSGRRSKFTSEDVPDQRQTSEEEITDQSRGDGEGGCGYFLDLSEEDLMMAEPELELA